MTEPEVTYRARVGFNFVDPRTKQEVRYEQGDPVDLSDQHDRIVRSLHANDAIEPVPADAEGGV